MYQCGCMLVCFCLCLCCWKNRLRYQKTAVLGWGKHLLFLVNTSTVYNNICFFFLLNFHRNTKSSQTLHWFCDSSSSPSLFCNVVVQLYRAEKEDYRDAFSFFSDFFFYMEIITLFSVCVNLCFSHFLISFCFRYNENWLHEILVCLFVFFSLNIAINTTSLGSHTYVNQHRVISSFVSL